MADYLYTKNGVPLKVSGKRIYNPAEHQFGSIQGYSDGNGGQCVEVAVAGHVTVRDTADRDGATLTLTPAAWQAFTSTLK